MTNKIMFLGGSASSVDMMVYAKELGYETYLCDNTNCVGRKLVDHDYMTSAADVEGVVKIMQDNEITNVVSYGSDVLAARQSEMVEKLNIRGNGVKVVQTLTQKDLFRKFLREHNFNEPYIAIFTKETFDINDSRLEQFPIMIKPVDSAGSKGVTKVTSKEMLQSAFEYALENSTNGKVIVEKFIVNKYPYVIGGDIFVSNGKIVFYGLMDELRDNPVNPFLPLGTFSHLFITKEEEKTLHNELDRLVAEVGFDYGGMNVEMIIDENNKPYFLELAPRNGGNRITDQLNYVCGVNLRRLQLDATLNRNIADYDNNFSSYTIMYILHSYKEGKLKSVNYSNFVKDRIVTSYDVKPIGYDVKKFINARTALGFVLIEFKNIDELKYFLTNYDNLVSIEVE